MNQNPTYQAFQAVRVTKEGDEFQGQAGNVRLLPTRDDPAYRVQMDEDKPGVLREYAEDELAGL
jgi:hypothetical protein